MRPQEGREGPLSSLRHAADTESGFLRVPLVSGLADKSNFPLCSLDVIRIGSREDGAEGPVKVLSLDQFLTEYVQKKKPVVLTGLIDETNDWSFSALTKVGGRIKVRCAGDS
jgi:hypothetical protein